MKKLIIFDGCDGTGKTSCATSLAEKINAVYYKTPPKIFENIRGIIESSKNYNLRFYYYFISMLYSAREISEILEHDCVICDRYIYSTIAYHRVLGVEVPSDLEQLVPVPDYAFCLYARDEVIKQRLSERSVFGALDNDLELQHKAFNEFKTFNLSLFDTSDLKIEESVAKILKIIHL